VFLLNNKIERFYRQTISANFIDRLTSPCLLLKGSGAVLPLYILACRKILF